MKARTRTSPKAKPNPAGFKLYRKVLKHKYGSQWRDFIKLG